ncbi:hypothetical protein OAP32_00535 [Crocinitomicaceae bacterium]|nr:hypothetical protein [Crocinitomicaceae bacterium]
MKGNERRSAESKVKTVNAQRPDNAGNVDTTLVILARAYNIAEDAIMEATAGAVVAATVTRMYVREQEKTYSVPTDAIGETIVSVVDDILETSGGTFELLEVSSYLGSTVYVDAVGEGGIFDDTGAIQDAINKASSLQYVKRGVKIVLRAPKNYYQVSSPLNFDELWNIHFECEVKNGWNRSEVGDIETRGGNVHWIGNSTDSLFNFGQYCFGVNFKNIVVNGRNTCKVAYDLSQDTPSVLRDYYFENCGAVYCDFGSVNGGITGTDLAPVTWINPIFTQNKSAALINNSGNATITLIGGFITGNGYDPSTGNSFIPDSDNSGFQLLNRAGHLSTLNITLDASTDIYPASGENVRISGGSATLDGWDDTPEVISVYTGGDVENIEFGKWRHFDGSMTKANTPVSISHGSKTVMTLGGGVFIFGDVSIRSGNQAAVVDNGVRFADSSSGFIGDAVDLGGLARTTASGYNEVASSIGGDIIRETGTFSATQSLLCRSNGVLTSKKVRGDGNTIVTESMDTSGRLSTYTNAYRDANTSEEKSIKAGDCIKMSIAGTGDWTFTTATASGADEVLSFTTKFGIRAGVGGNARKKLVLDVNEMAFEAPNSGSVTRGSVYYRSSATPGGKAGDIVTTTGTVGSTAVLKPFGVIDV